MTRGLVVLGVGLVATIVALLVLTRGSVEPVDVVPSATITASSSEITHDVHAVADGDGHSSRRLGWVAQAQSAGAWVKLTWARPRTLSRLVISPAEASHRVATAAISFSDGSSLFVGFPNGGASATVLMGTRSVTWMKLTVLTMRAGATSAGWSELRAYQPSGPRTQIAAVTPRTQAGAEATVTTSGTAVGSHPAAVTDGSVTAAGSTVGASWRGSSPGAGSWVQLDWPRPRELVSVQLLGAAGTPSSILSGTLQFSDGSRIPVGAVLGDPGLPTTVAFMPRSVTSVRFTADTTGGTGGIALSEFRAFDRGSTPPAAAASPSQHLLPVDFPNACPSDRAGSTRAGAISVVCPTSTAAVEEEAALVLQSAAIARIDVDVLPPTPGAATPGTVTLIPDASGASRGRIDLSSMPRGPVTVRLRGFSRTNDTAPLESATVFLQLYHSRGVEPARTGTSSRITAGKTLAFQEEFDGNVSATPSGADAEYAASKPEAAGPASFGDAGFADPALGAGTLSIIDDRYLRMSVVPDPTGSGSLGGSLASARVGGSGFSAQYGYFEARMMFPAAPGTWPAFWMLPANDLVAEQSPVAEIDAVESYGFNPRSNCQSTHSYANGTDAGVARCGRRFPSTTAALGWHRYGVDVKPAGIVYYIDGVQVATAPSLAGDGDPLFFMTDLALGGGFPVDLGRIGGRAAAYVDWVRVYT